MKNDVQFFEETHKIKRDPHKFKETYILSHPCQRKHRNTPHDLNETGIDKKRRTILKRNLLASKETHINSKKLT